MARTKIKPAPAQLSRQLERVLRTYTEQRDWIMVLATLNYMLALMERGEI